MTTIREIARRVGVSTATVSRVVNQNDHPVNPETRRKILAAMHELQFSKHAYSNLLEGRCWMIHLYLGVDLIEDPGIAHGLAQIAVGIRRFFHQSGAQYCLDVCDDLQDAMRKVPLMRDLPSMGWIVLSPRPESPLIARLVEASIPFIVLGTRHFKGYDFVDADNLGGGSLAVRHLAGLGRKRIALIAGPADAHSSLDHVLGYRAALKELSLPERPEWLRRTSCYSVEEGRQLTGEMLRLAEPPDALFCSSDFMAVGALQAAAQLGVRVPDEFTVVGYGEHPLATITYPELTTFRHHGVEMAALAAQCLVKDIIPRKTPIGYHQHLLAPELIV